MHRVITMNRTDTPAVSRVTISVPTKLLESVDNELVQEGETRSGLIRRLLEKALREAKEREDIERYVRGYREEPQTEEEFGWSDQALLEHLKELPWEPRT
jgi:Arc/MetJ-type ribon-helix-helix transcriptional regulator